MSTPSPTRRRVHRYGLAGIGSAVLFVGIASPAAAAPDVVIPLAPPLVAVSGFPIENYGAVDLMGSTAPTPQAVQYGDTLTVRLPAELVDASAVVMLDLDVDGDQVAEVTYDSSLASTDPLYLDVTGEGTDTLVITLPAHDGTDYPLAYLVIDPGTSLGPEFVAHPFVYELAIDTDALDPLTLSPGLIADSELPCPTAAACTLTVGATTTFTLPVSSLLRQVGVSDLSGFEVALAALDADGDPTGAAPVELTGAVSADGQSVTFVVPAGTPAGRYFLLAIQPTTAGASVVLGEVAVAAAAAPAPAAQPVAAPVTAAPTTQAVAGNVGLRSNTGVTAPAETSSAGVVAGGLGLLALAGAGGVAVARTRRPAATGAGEV